MAAGPRLLADGRLAVEPLQRVAADLALLVWRLLADLIIALLVWRLLAGGSLAWELFVEPLQQVAADIAVGCPFWEAACSQKASSLSVALKFFLETS